MLLIIVEFPTTLYKFAIIKLFYIFMTQSKFWRCTFLPAKKLKFWHVALIIAFIFLVLTLHAVDPNTIVMAEVTTKISNMTTPSLDTPSPSKADTSATSEPQATTTYSNNNNEKSYQSQADPSPLNSISSTPTLSSQETLNFSTLPRDQLAITQESIIKLLTNHSGTYGVYFEDQLTGQSFSINGDASFPAASTFKIPLTLYLYINKIPLDQTVTYQNTFYEDGTGSLQTSIKEGDQFSLRTLASLAIRESDNIAANMILATIGRNNILSFEQMLGGTTPSSKTTNYTSAHDLGEFIRKCQSYPSLLNDLENTIYNDRIPAGIPPEITVAHKIGTFPGGVFNDVGIIFARRPFVLAVVSKNVNSEDEAAEVIANISTLCYNLVSMYY